MPQVNSPNVPKDDSLNTAMAGLQIYSGVQDIRAKSAREAAASATTSPNAGSIDAMQRRLNTDPSRG